MSRNNIQHYATNVIHTNIKFSYREAFDIAMWECFFTNLHRLHKPMGGLACLLPYVQHRSWQMHVCVNAKSKQQSV